MSQYPSIPLVDLKANYESIKEEIDKEVHEVMSTAAFILGPKVEKFEKEFAQFCGADFCLGVANGTDAIEIALEAAGIGAGDEVITQANTYVATVLSISAVGATPVLVDIDPKTMMMNADLIEKKITPKTKAIIPVHLYGFMADMDRILEIAKKHNLIVVEDCAQAHGATYKGKGAGTFGAIGSFSFYPGKNLGAFGDGGAVITNEKKHYEHIRFKRNWGSVKKYYHEEKGYNSRLDGIQAGILSAKLRHLAKWNERRREIAAKYNELLNGVGDIQLPVVPENVVPVWHLYVIQTAKREELMQYLNERNIGASIHYPIPIHKLGAYKELEYLTPELPVTTEAATRILSLPIYPDLTEAQQQRVIDTVKEFFAKQ